MLILNLVLPTGLLVSRVEKHVEGVRPLKLPAGCYLDCHANIHAVALSWRRLRAAVAFAGGSARWVCEKIRPRPMRRDFCMG
jgi:hypothetical protein